MLAYRRSDAALTKRISRNTWLLFKRRQRQFDSMLVSLGLQLSGFAPRLLGPRAIVDGSRQFDGKVAICRHRTRTPCERIKLNFHRPLLLLLRGAGLADPSSRDSSSPVTFRSHRDGPRLAQTKWKNSNLAPALALHFHNFAPLALFPPSWSCCPIRGAVVVSPRAGCLSNGSNAAPPHLKLPFQNKHRSAS